MAPSGKAWKIYLNTYSGFPTTVEDIAKLDLDTKESALRAASSVVCLKSFTGGKELSICSGIIMECDNQSGSFFGTIWTSATLLRCLSGAATLADDVKIDVYLVGGKLFEGQVIAFDFHYNIAVIKIKSDAPLSTATVRRLDVSMAIDPGNHHDIEDSSSFQLPHHQDFSLYPGEPVLALGRYFEDPYDIMVAPGIFRSGGCQFDCKELLKASCKITKIGIGGPVVNCCGEVIGINFYDPSYTPFLPVNIASRCFGDLMKNGRIPRPWLGLNAIDLYAADLVRLEKLNLMFPHVKKGAIIKEVLQNSPADLAGICANDVITSCGGNLVGSCLELNEVLWHKEGESVEVVVVRESAGEQLNLVVEVVKTNPKELRWPIPKPCRQSLHPLHRIIM